MRAARVRRNGIKDRGGAGERGEGRATAKDGVGADEQSSSEVESD